MAMTKTAKWLRSAYFAAAFLGLLGSSALQAQQLSGDALVEALRGGGHVLVIRNAQSAAEPPPENRLSPANFDGEREIDEYGQGQMSVIGYAFRELRIPIGETWTSPAYRSRQSGNYLGFGKQGVATELTENADASALQARVQAQPPAGKNTVIVTHGALIEKTLGRPARNVGAAETLIYRPREGGADFVARLTVEDWAKLAVK